MKRYKIVVMLVLVVVLITSGVALGAPTKSQTEQTEDEVGMYTPGEDDPLAIPLAITGFSDLVMHGSMWQPQTPWFLAYFKPYGWGTEFRGKGASDQWVHIAVPYASYLDGTALKIKQIEFCARSTNGAQTKPVQVDMWSNTTRFAQYPINWWTDNNQHCWYVTYGTPAWRESLGLSVKLHFANATDRIILYKAWVRLEP